MTDFSPVPNVLPKDRITRKGVKCLIYFYFLMRNKGTRETREKAASCPIMDGTILEPIWHHFGNVLF